MRVDAMMGEAEGEDEKTLMIQSLRAMVDGLKRQVGLAPSPPLLLAGSCMFPLYLILTRLSLVHVQIASDSEVVSEAIQARNKAEQALAHMRATGMLTEEQEQEACQFDLSRVTAAEAVGEVQQLGPSHYQDLQESAEALKAMRAQKEALEKDFGVLLADKHALEMQLSSSDEILAAEKARSQQACADRAEMLQKLEALQAGMDRTSHATNGAERAAARLELVQHQIAQGLEQVTDTVTEVARLRDNVGAPELRQQMCALGQSLDQVAQHGFKALEAFEELDQAKREIENLRRAQEVANSALTRLQSQVMERGQQIADLQRQLQQSTMQAPGQHTAASSSEHGADEAKRDESRQLLERAHSEKIEALERAHCAAMDKVQNEHQQTVSELQHEIQSLASARPQVSDAISDQAPGEWEQKYADLELVLSQRGEEVSRKQAEVDELAAALEEARKMEPRLQGLSAELKELKARHGDKVAELAGVVEDMQGGLTESFTVMRALDSAGKDLHEEHGRVLQEKGVLERDLEAAKRDVEAAKRDVESSQAEVAKVKSALQDVEQDRARLMARLEEMASQPQSPQRGLEAEQVVREEMQQTLETTRQALRRAEEEVAMVRADAAERERAEADSKADADMARAESEEWQRKHAALGLLLSQQAEEVAVQHEQAREEVALAKQGQSEATDRLGEVEQELEATKRTVEEAEASAAKVRADAEASCNKWEQAYAEAQRRCGELEASNEKVQGELRSLSCQQEDQVRQIAGLTESLASMEEEKVRRAEEVGEWEQKHAALGVRMAQQASELQMEVEGWQRKHADLELVLSQRGEEVSRKQAEVDELAAALEEARKMEPRLQGLSVELKELKARHGDKVAELAGVVEDMQGGLTEQEQAREELALAKQGQSEATDRLGEVEQELEATKRTVEEAEASAAKVRADAEASCNKWEQAYAEAQRRCGELEASTLVLKKEFAEKEEALRQELLTLHAALDESNRKWKRMEAEDRARAGLVEEELSRLEAVAGGAAVAGISDAPPAGTSDESKGAGMAALFSWSEQDKADACDAGRMDAAGAVAAPQAALTKGSSSEPMLEDKEMDQMREEANRLRQDVQMLETARSSLEQQLQAQQQLVAQLNSDIASTVKELQEAQDACTDAVGERDAARAEISVLHVKLEEAQRQDVGAHRGNVSPNLSPAAKALSQELYSARSLRMGALQTRAEGAQEVLDSSRDGSEVPSHTGWPAEMLQLRHEVHASVCLPVPPACRLSELAATS